MSPVPFITAQDCIDCAKFPFRKLGGSYAGARTAAAALALAPAAHPERVAGSAPCRSAVSAAQASASQASASQSAILQHAAAAVHALDDGRAAGAGHVSGRAAGGVDGGAAARAGAAAGPDRNAADDDGVCDRRHLPFLTDLEHGFGAAADWLVLAQLRLFDVGYAVCDEMV